MISKFAARIGGGVLAGVFALAGSGAAAPQGSGPAPAETPQACESAAARVEAARARMERAVALAEARVSAAPVLAAQASQRAWLAMDRAMEAAQATAWSVAQYRSSDDGPGWLGIRMEEVGSARAKELKLPAERGAQVTYVAEDSPAAKAGLKVNDVVIEFEGQRVEGTMALQRMVHEVPAGRTVSLSIWRDGHAQSLTVEIVSRRSGEPGDRTYFFASPRADMDVEIAPMPPIPPIPPIPSTPAIDFGPLGSFRMFGAPILGIDSEDLSGQLGNYFGAPEGQGILVREVMPGTPAEKANLKAGDVILRVDGKRVKNTDELRSALRDKATRAGDGADEEKSPAPTADLTVLRAGKESIIRVELQPPVKRIRPVRRMAV